MENVLIIFYSKIREKIILFFFFFFLVAKLTSTEDVSASIASTSELGIVAIAAVDLVYLAAKLFVYQRCPTFVTKEASLVPVLVLVREILQNKILHNYIFTALYWPKTISQFDNFYGKWTIFYQTWDWTFLSSQETYTLYKHEFYENWNSSNQLLPIMDIFTNLE